MAAAAAAGLAPPLFFFLPPFLGMMVVTIRKVCAEGVVRKGHVGMTTRCAQWEIVETGRRETVGVADGDTY